MGRGRKKSQEIKEEATYSTVPEADEIVKQLCQRYPEILWACNPNEIQVYGIDNKERPASSDVLAKIRKVTGVMAAVLNNNNIKLKYLIELYHQDFANWSNVTKKWIIFHELLHILNPEDSKLRKHNVQDFGIVVDKIGWGSYESENLPDLLGDKKIEFDPAEIAKLHSEGIEKKEEEDGPVPPE